MPCTQQPPFRTPSATGTTSRSDVSQIGQRLLMTGWAHHKIRPIQEIPVLDDRFHHPLGIFRGGRPHQQVPDADTPNNACRCWSTGSLGHLNTGLASQRDNVISTAGPASIRPLPPPRCPGRPLRVGVPRIDGSRTEPTEHCTHHRSAPRAGNACWMRRPHPRGGL